MMARLLATRAVALSLNLDAVGATADALGALPLAESVGDERSLGRAKLALGHLLAYVDHDAAAATLAEAIQHAGECPRTASVRCTPRRCAPPVCSCFVATRWRVGTR